MSIVSRYVWWPEHDAGGLLPPVDVLAGVLAPAMWRVPPSWPPLAADEALVYVPPQWIGDWEHGHALAPGYQHVWRVAVAALLPLSSAPRTAPYRPATLPETATGPRRVGAWSRARRSRSERGGDGSR